MNTNELFHYNIIKCPCGCAFYKFNSELIYRLSNAVYSTDTHLHITSWCRCVSYNYTVKGVPRSSHLDGKAIDITCVEPMERYEIIKALIGSGFKRIIVYANHIHTDISKIKIHPYLSFEGG